MPSVVVDIAIDADEFLRVYRGTAKIVRVTARDGRTVRFPADKLRAFVTRTGVYGGFRLTFDPDGKFQAIERVS